MKPEISVIIPCYNYGSYLSEAIDSVFNQTFKNFEVIIVDDGSTEKNTINFLNKLNEIYPSVRLIRKENGGLASARNIGIRVAEGDFFVPLDADDKIEPRFLEKCISALKENPEISFVYTYTKQFGDTNEIIARNEYNFFNLLKVNYIVATCLFRKEVWSEVGGYDEAMKNWYEDWEFLIRLGERGHYGKLIREPLFCYRKHGETMVSEAIRKHDEVFTYIKQKHPELFSQQNISKLNNEWNQLRFKRFIDCIVYTIHSIKYKLIAAGISDMKNWKKNHIKMFFRFIPVGIKKKVNIFLHREFFDLNYFGKKE